MSAAAIILAAGRSTRMGGVDKLLVPLGSRPLVEHAISTFLDHADVDELVIVTAESNREAIAAILGRIAPSARIVLGGARRRDSVRAGLSLVTAEHVIVHDGARPLVTPDLISSCLGAAREVGAALCAVPVNDTLKRVEDGGLVQATVSREGLWQAQTPQAFRTQLLRRAHAATDIDATDDAALVELIGEPACVVMGSSRNIKVTSQADLALAEALLS